MKLLDVLRKFKGFDLVFEAFVFWSYIYPMKNKGCFSGTNRLGLPDVLFCVSGRSPKLPII